MAVKNEDPADKGMIRVLVYGTLKKDHGNHGLMREADAEFIGYDSITGAYKLHDLGNIPACVDAADKEGISRIRGELYAIQPEGLAALDLLEGHPHLYQRRKVWTDIHKRRTWVYMLMSQNFLGNSAQDKMGLWRPSDDEKIFWAKQFAA